MSIETVSVTKLKDCLLRSEYIETFFSEHDKGPSWDGYIILYNSKTKHTKNNIINRLPVQIKGKQINDLLQSEILYNVKKADLNNYLNDGGAIFFVVYIVNHDNYKIYYETLTKIKLRMYLRKCKEKSSISIHLQEIPDDINKISDIFFNFANDFNQSLSQKTVNIDDFIKKRVKGYEAFKITYKGIAYKNNPINYFLNNQTTIYAESSSGGPDIAIATGLLSSFYSKPNSPVFIDNKKYYDSFKVEIKANENKVLFGNSCSFTFNLKENTIKFYWNIKGNLTQRILDTSFLINLLEYKIITIDTDNFNIPLTDEQISKSNFDINYFKENLAFLKKIKKLLDYFGIKEELEYDLVSNDEEQILLFLLNNVFNHVPYKNKQSEPFLLQKVKIANIIFLIEIVKKNDSECEIKNFFSTITDSVIWAVKSKSIVAKASQFFILKKEDFASLNNINYDAIYNSIITIESSKLFISHLIQFTLEMLGGYDNQKRKDYQLLDCVIRIYDFMLQKEPKNELYIINKLQTIKRKTELNTKQKQMLLQIANTTKDTSLKVAAFLLYGDIIQAEYYFKQLPLSDQKKFKEYPIGLFWSPII